MASLRVKKYSSIFRAVVKAPYTLLPEIFFLVARQEMSLSLLVKFEKCKCALLHLWRVMLPDEQTIIHTYILYQPATALNCSLVPLIFLFGTDRVDDDERRPLSSRSARQGGQKLAIFAKRLLQPDDTRERELRMIVRSRRREHVLGMISICRYASHGEARSPEHSIDPGSTHLSLGERVEGLHFREAVTSRGRYPALTLLHCPFPPPSLCSPYTSLYTATFEIPGSLL